MAALVGLPPFPGFWAKWELIMQLAAGGRPALIALILAGSLLEAAYLFRWFSHARNQDAAGSGVTVSFWQPLPVLLATLMLFAIGYGMATLMAFDARAMFLPLLAGLLLWMIDALPGRLKNLALLLVVGSGGFWLTRELTGLNSLFGYLLIGGGLLVSVAAFYRADRRSGFYPLLAVLLLSLATLLRATTSLEFFFGWELMTLSSYLLITLGRKGVGPALAYLLFSLGSAYFIFAGFAAAYATTGSLLLADLGASSSPGLVFGLLAAGFVIKLGGFGVHVWLPDAYAEADDDFTALLSAVVSKAGIFGLVLIAAQLGIRSNIGLDPAYVLGWLGILTATFGALMAVFQEDIKRLVAYSSMGQLGYIVTGVALMSHLGWVSALYLTVNHFLFKGILFLGVAGIVLRTNERLMYKMGGLIKNMPFTFVFTMIAIIAMSGVPPLTGFGGKWMLFNALMDKGWYFLAAFAFFSRAVAFMYMFRLLHTWFLGLRKVVLVRIGSDSRQNGHDDKDDECLSHCRCSYGAVPYLSPVRALVCDPTRRLSQNDQPPLCEQNRPRSSTTGASQGSRAIGLIISFHPWGGFETSGSSQGWYHSQTFLSKCQCFLAMPASSWAFDRGDCGT